MKQPIGSIAQIAYIVENLEQAMDHWINFLDIGPFFVIEDFQLIEPQYRGRPMGDIKFRVALGFSGGVCIELIEQIDDTPSVFREVAMEKGFCFHHWAYMTRDFDNEVKKYQDQGIEICFSGAVGVGGRFVYLDATEETQSMIEIIEFNPKVEAFFAMIEEAAVNWDGTEPVRYF